MSLFWTITILSTVIPPVIWAAWRLYKEWRHTQVVIRRIKGLEK